MYSWQFKIEEANDKLSQLQGMEPCKLNFNKALDKTFKIWESLHRRFVIVTIDKAANNYALICSKFYMYPFLGEVGILSNSNTKTYSKVNTSKEDIINTK